MRSIHKAVRADRAKVIISGIAFKKAYTAAQRRSRVIIHVVCPAGKAAAVMTRTRARELRDALDMILGDKP